MVLRFWLQAELRNPVGGKHALRNQPSSAASNQGLLVGNSTGANSNTITKNKKAQ